MAEDDEAPATAPQPDTPPVSTGAPPPKRAPAVYLKWAGPGFFGHVPTQGTGPDGVLTPAETQAYFTHAEYEQAIKDGTYARVAKKDATKDEKSEHAVEGGHDAQS